MVNTIKREEKPSLFYMTPGDDLELIVLNHQFKNTGFLRTGRCSSLYHLPGPASGPAELIDVDATKPRER